MWIDINKEILMIFCSLRRLNSDSGGGGGNETFGWWNRHWTRGVVWWPSRRSAACGKSLCILSSLAFTFVRIFWIWKMQNLFLRRKSNFFIILFSIMCNFPVYLAEHLTHFTPHWSLSDSVIRPTRHHPFFWLLESSVKKKSLWCCNCN